MKEKGHFETSQITKDMSFWSEEKYLVPFDPQDALLFNFEEDDELEQEIGEEERQQMLKDAKLEQEIADNFREQMRVHHGVDLDDLRD